VTDTPQESLPFGLAAGFADHATAQAVELTSAWHQLKAVMPFGDKTWDAVRAEVVRRQYAQEADGELSAVQSVTRDVVVGRWTPGRGLDSGVAGGVPTPPGWTLAEMQAGQPWTAPYSKAYRESRDEGGEGHRDALHALAHVVKAAGVLVSVCEWADHSDVRLDRVSQVDWQNRIADLVMNALYLANHPPPGYDRFNLQGAVVARTEQVNGRGFVRAAHQSTPETRGTDE
jgi:hypothetical protein